MSTYRVEVVTYTCKLVVEKKGTCMVGKDGDKDAWEVSTLVVVESGSSKGS